MTETAIPTAVHFRPPQLTDAAAIWRIVRGSGVLDPNSPYCYMLLCRDFSATCTVAEVAGDVVGFVTAYIPPGRSDTLFVWQIGVDAAHRGGGIGTCLLTRLLEREACRRVTHVETTITPSNRASMALFDGLARQTGATVAEVPGFGTELFPGEGHEPERRYRIGPLGRPNAH